MAGKRKQPLGSPSHVTAPNEVASTSPRKRTKRGQDAATAPLEPPITPRRSSRPKAESVARVRQDVFDDSGSELSEDPEQETAIGGSDASEFDHDSDPPPKKKRKTPAKPKPKPKKAKTGSKFDEDAPGDGEAQTPEKKTPRKRKPKVVEPVVYDIPEVEKKETTFKGRLGYACLNTILRNLKPEPVFCSRTCRIATIKEKGMDFVFDLGRQNLRDLMTLIEWNEQNQIKFMRMSSEMFPFASHAEYGYDLSYVDKELKEAGDLAKKYGHRLTMHPGQFTQLGSPKEEVVTASIRELQYQCEIMDRMGLDQDSVMIIHMGGVYGDKESALARFKVNYQTKLPDSLKMRLVLENDEICYNLDDIMPTCKELDIPIVVDYHHDWIYPSERPVKELIPIINETWKKKGIKVKQHLSEPRPGAVTPMEKRAHADRCQMLPEGLPDDVDLMIEAKDKEQAVFELYRIYSLKDVKHENLRPPKKHQTLATAGKKSVKSRKKPMGPDEPDGVDVVLEGLEKEGDEVVLVDSEQSNL